ncbi:MAG: FecR domain-containing protein, partial [Leptospiraceae bacterium]|nr:FecR domain-containing protein [Leptospiraceae bacterium]
LITQEKARIDVQIEGLAIIRIVSSGSLEFRKILSSEKEEFRDTWIHLQEGKIYVKVEKISSLDRIRFTTEDCIIDVKGTEFILVNDKNKTKIMLAEGKLNIRPSVKILNSAKQKNENLKNLEILALNKMISLEANQELLIPKFSPLFYKEDLNEDELWDLKKELEQLQWVIKPIEYTKIEEQELKTLVMEDPSITTQMIEINEELNSGRLDEARILELEAARSSLENKILKKQESAKTKFNESILVVPKKLKTKRDIVRYYERMEKIILKRNRVEIGAIVSQEGDVIVVHTEDGIKRIPHEDVVETIYEYQKKIRY